MTTILNIETSTNVCSVALGCDGKVVAERHNDAANHAVMLPVFIDEILKYIRQHSLHLDAICVSGGPGSYTGLRIGVSTAKGLCYGMSIPLLAIDTTEVIAAHALQKTTLDTDALICPMIDARRMEVYTALYDINLTRLTDITPLVVEADSFAQQLLTHQVYFCGNGADKCKQTLTHPNAHFIDKVEAMASAMTELSFSKFQQVQNKETKSEDVAYYTPFYLKEFQAAASHVKGLR